ncbi:MAG: hypothetical protein O3A37_04795 [Planctomycetota bacterium]|jgi:hypothetical protein|nr:hypothetical protein [Planctomycetota bacterium]
MLIALPNFTPSCHSSLASLVPCGPMPALVPYGGGSAVEVRCGGDTDDDEEDLGDEEDLSTPDPDVDEESVFDDFDDEFDDDFEEEENDPDWDHPEDTESDEPPPAKAPGRKK